MGLPVSLASEMGPAPDRRSTPSGDCRSRIVIRATNKHSAPVAIRAGAGEAFVDRKHMRDEIWCWIPVPNENPYCIWLERSFAADKFEVEALIAALQEMTPFRRRAAARCRHAGCERMRACQKPLSCQDKFVRARAERDWEVTRAERNAALNQAARHAQDCARAAKLVRAARARLKSLVSAGEPH